MSKPYVFISYSRQDREFVEKLTNALSAAGVETWTDVSNIAPGQNWQAQIEQGLLGAEVLLYVSSRNTSASQWMERELHAFTTGTGRVIPLIVDAAGEHSLPNALRQFQWADFRGDFNVAIQSLVKGLASLRQSKPLARPEAKSKGYVFISYASKDEAFVEELKTHMKGRGYRSFCLHSDFKRILNFDVIAVADQCWYETKHDGRNRVPWGASLQAISAS